MHVAHVILIFGIYIAIAIGKLPRLRMNRATIALTGAALLVLTGAISEVDAIQAIDMGTILLLAAMMVINVNLRWAGFFRTVTGHTLRIAKHPQTLLALIIVASGLLSALFLNDTICLMLTPLVIDVTRKLGRNPVPYLIGLATAANIGSVATITGNPQNIIIGKMSGIAYVTFLLKLAPVALVGLFVCWVIIWRSYPQEFQGVLKETDLVTPRPFTPLFYRTMLVVCGLMLAFLLNAPIITAACVAAALLLISRIHPYKLLALDWDLLAFFAGLFVITRAIETTGLSAQFVNAVLPLLETGVPGLSVMTAILSNIVSNIPAVLLLQSTVSQFGNAQQAWLTLAMASTLAGNLTLLGSAATLIVAELAKQEGVELSFSAYLRVGVPITLITLLFGIFWMML